MPEDRDRTTTESSTDSIKVTDRRAFSADGERRETDTESSAGVATAPSADGASGQPKAAADRATADKAAVDSAATDSAASDSAAGDRAAGDRAAGDRAAGDRAAGDRAEGNIDFIAFLQSLYISSLMALGEVENPETKQFVVNLEMARQNIDILALLQTKTQGNLTSQEESFLQQTIPQLQMLFVNKAG